MTVTYFIKTHWELSLYPNVISLPTYHCRQSAKRLPTALMPCRKPTDSSFQTIFFPTKREDTTLIDLFCVVDFDLFFLEQPLDHPTSSTYYQVISRFSLIVPRSLMSTATTWGRAANRSFVSQVTLPTRMWVARPFTSVTYERKKTGHLEPRKVL